MSILSVIGGKKINCRTWKSAPLALATARTSILRFFFRQKRIIISNITNVYIILFDAFPNLIQKLFLAKRWNSLHNIDKVLLSTSPYWGI